MRGKTYAKELKEEILREVKEVGNVSLVARRHGISKSTIFTWIKESKNKDEIKVKPGKKALVEGDKELESELTEVTHTTLLLKAGVNPKVVSERLGHSKVNITLDTYSHVLPSMQKYAVIKLTKTMGL